MKIERRVEDTLRTTEVQEGPVFLIGKDPLLLPMPVCYAWEAEVRSDEQLSSSCETQTSCLPQNQERDPSPGGLGHTNTGAVTNKKRALCPLYLLLGPRSGPV